MTVAADQLAKALEKYRLRFASEKQLQDGFAEVCRLEGWEVRREHRLSACDVPDFFFPASGRVVEIKVAGGVSEVERQLARYAAHREVKVIILLTSRRTHAAVATEIGGKPVRVVLVDRNLI